MAGTLASANEFPSLLIKEGTAPSSPASGDQRVYIDSADHKLKRKNSSGTVTTIEGSAGFSFAWSSGTSMPGSPATNDRVTRTDLGLDFYWDGTRWLTTQLFVQTVFPATNPAAALGASFSNAGVPAWTDFAMWLVDWRVAVYVAGTNNGSNYWSFTLNGTATISTAASGGSTWLSLAAAIGASSGAAVSIDLAGTKVGAAGSIFFGAVMRYRLIGT